MNYWFTADCHFGHENILKYCKRPFKTLEEMNTTLIKRWNDRVKKGDWVFHLGDFCFRNCSNRGEGTIHKADYYLKQLNGHIILLDGSHDSNNTVKTCIKGIDIKLGGHNVHLVHDPRDIKGGFDFNLVGHVHEKWKVKEFSVEVLNALLDKVVCINVGVDVWNFYPVSIQEIIIVYHNFEKKRSKNE